MTIAAEDLAHIRATRPAFAEDRDRTGALFYATLFAAQPQLRSMFPEDVSDQGRKLATTIAVAIDGSDDWSRLTPVLETLARRHLSYGVKPDHYGMVGAALIETLRQAGANPSQIDAWKRVYASISNHMIVAAYGAAS